MQEETLFVRLNDGSTDTIWKKYFNPELHTIIDSNEPKEEKPKAKGRPRKSS